MELAVKDVSVRFGGLLALDTVGFTIRQGELAALIGPNGAGKSTLIDVVSGARRPTSGSVRFGGREIAGLPAHRVTRLGIARTFQGLELFRSLSVRENVIAGGVQQVGAGFWRNLAQPRRGTLAQRLEDAASTALILVGLARRADDPANILPAGEQRLLAIARALATGSDWLILDEPGAGLNETEKRALGNVIKRLRDQGKTILFVDHDMALVGSVAERLVVLDRGAVIADGMPDRVRTDERVIRAYLGVKPRAAPPRAATAVRPPTLLAASGLSVSYGGVRALEDVTVRVGQGELVAVVGANGAGKSTLMRALTGTLTPRAGTLVFDGAPVGALPAAERVRRGLALVPEGRELFGSLTVLENLMLGAYSHGGGLARWLPMGAMAAAGGHDRRLAEIIALFPRLGERRHQLAGSLSGGEGQMLAIGRALMSRPRLLLLDEPSLGLAPQVVEEILDCLLALRRDGLSILLVEQNARTALEIADHGYVLETGRIVAEGQGASLLATSDLAAAYLGMPVQDVRRVHATR
jgi:branched-chain amino acid transport system ATP-binding protein